MIGCLQISRQIAETWMINYCVQIIGTTQGPRLQGEVLEGNNFTLNEATGGHVSIPGNLYESLLEIYQYKSANSLFDFCYVRPSPLFN